jgi:DNA-directed RNA polymerase subunit RPC12/RpoP
MDEDPVKERRLCPSCGSRRLLEMRYGYILFPPTSVKRDSHGRDRIKRDDVRNALKRFRHGGCCVDFNDLYECARCHCHIPLECLILQKEMRFERPPFDRGRDENDEP